MLSVIKKVGRYFKMKEKNGLIGTIFRFLVIAAFILGVVYLIQFIRIGLSDSDIDTDEIQALCGSFSKSYYLYLILTLASFVLSIVCFKKTGPVVSVFRTICLGISSILIILPIKVVNVLHAISNFDLDDLDEYDEYYDEVKILSNEDELAKILLPLIATVILLILAITSVVNLVKNKKK